MGTLHENQYPFFIIFRSVFLIMRNASNKVLYIYNQNTHFIFDFFFKSSRLWDTVENCNRAEEAIEDNMQHVH